MYILICSLLHFILLLFTVIKTDDKIKYILQLPIYVVINDYFIPFVQLYDVSSIIHIQQCVYLIEIIYNCYDIYLSSCTDSYVFCIYYDNYQEGSSPVMIAAMKGYKDIILMLIQEGANLNLVNSVSRYLFVIINVLSLFLS